MRVSLFPFAQEIGVESQGTYEHDWGDDAESDHIDFAVIHSAGDIGIELVGGFLKEEDAAVKDLIPKAVCGTLGYYFLSSFLHFLIFGSDGSIPRM
jgi:hypothetical protein